MKKKRFFACAAATFAFVTAFAGCERPKHDDDEPTDSTKTQLYVGQEANGYGVEWCEKTADAFEAWAAEKSYEPGKKGVQVHISTKGFTGGPFLNEISGSRANVFFSEEMYYYDYVSKGVLMDVTEAITTPLTEFGETETIEEKMIKNSGTQLKEALTGLDGKYYALPWWSGLEGITYDVDLFDENSLYFAKGGAPSEYLRTKGDAAISGAFTAYAYTNLAGERSAGPDGKYGTMDDGLPATFEEFYELCNTMKTKRQITPMTCTGQYNYVDMIVDSMYANLEGYENMRMHQDFTGTAYDIVESYNTKADGSIDFDSIKYMGGADGVAITKENGYLLQRQVGKLYTLEFCKTLLDKGYFSDNCFTGDFSHTSMQEYWLKAKYKNNFERSAMLIDGTWWLGEASSVFESMETVYDGSGRNERRFGFMSYPKATVDQVGEAGARVSQKSAMCAVNGNITDPNIKQCAIDFFRFCHTDEALKIFNETTGGIRAFDFDYTDEEWSNLNYFSKSTYDFNNTYDVVYPLAYNKLYLNTQSYFTTNAYGWNANLSGVGTGVKQVVKTMKNYNVTPNAYYQGILSYYTKEDWNNRFSAYFN